MSHIVFSNCFVFCFVLMRSSFNFREFPKIQKNKYECKMINAKYRIMNEIKITNLPKECTVKIFTLDGSLVKTLKKDNDDQTFISWNLPYTAHFNYRVHLL